MVKPATLMSTLLPGYLSSDTLPLAAPSTRDHASRPRPSACGRPCAPDRGTARTEYACPVVPSWAPVSWRLFPLPSLGGHTSSRRSGEHLPGQSLVGHTLADHPAQHRHEAPGIL